MRLVTTAMLAILAAASLTACSDDESGQGETSNDSSSQPGPETFTVTGKVSLTDDEMGVAGYLDARSNCIMTGTECDWPAGAYCEAGSAGFSDIAAGAQVSVTDSTGAVVGLGTLEPDKSAALSDIGNQDYPVCVFAFEVNEVPDSGNIYGLSIGRRDVQFTKDQAGMLNLSLGE